MKAYLCAAVICGLMCGPTWAASDATAPDVDPRARALLVEMTEAYKQLQSYSGHVEITAGAGSSNSSVSYEKPDLAYIYTKSPSGEFKTVSDGKAIYMVRPGDDKEYEEIKSGGSPASIALAIRTGGASVIGLFPFAASGNDPFVLMSRNLKSLKLLKPSVVDGTHVDEVEAVETAPGHKDAVMTLAIGEADHLLRSVAFESGDGQAIQETFTEVKVNTPVSSTLFRFTPPAGAKEIAVSPS